ncbi:MAG: beta-ketoacyl-ACP synthase II [Lentisphaerae bacterium]|jgi:3-oxoacyl-[acyl-carrier-protein] synthase II|nr:beta-ketoacyl-ACP synthase II [Lentisphaerota bacterium]
MYRTVITGIGVVSPLGSDLDTFWSNLITGVNGIGQISRFDTTNFPVTIAAEVQGFNVDEFIDRKEQRRTDAFSHYAIAAARMAIADSGFDTSAGDPFRHGCIISSGIGGIVTTENEILKLQERGPSRVSPFCIPQILVNMPSGLVAIEHNLKGANFAVVSACASGLHSIGDAMHIIKRGEADMMLAGGCEASIGPIGVAGFAALHALSRRNDDPAAASRPFDKDRDGFVIGEGGTVLVLEEYEHAKKRSAKIYAEIVSIGQTCDAFHMTAPSDDGSGFARAIKHALDAAEVNASEVDYINAHGTSTPMNDRTETKAIKVGLGEDNARKTMISSTKSMLGHMLGAAGAIESAVCALAVKNGVIPPTINYTTPDPDCDLDYVPNTAREAEVNVCLNNSLGFGGHNACALFKKV